MLLARDGAILRSEQSRFGTSIRTERTSEADAKAPFEPFRVLGSVMLKSPFRIGTPALLGQIRYVYRYRDGVPFPIPQTGEQRFRIEDGKAILDICAACGPATMLSEEERAAALRPTPWLQSSHKLVRAIADPVARLAVSNDRKMELLAERARQKLSRIDFAGHFSAAEALRRRAGDCTEDALVLAAAARAIGIPARVASGLVYSREKYHGVSNVFMPHSWTIVWIDGRWRSYDMSLGGFDATHIAFTLGDGDRRSIAAASQLAGLVEWEAMAQVRTRE
jgi:transglutaminase-like putative cysteine protease